MTLSPPSEPSDGQLLTAVAAGDHAAFSIFYDRMAGLLHGIALRVLRNRAMAEEVTQEVFVELWRTADRFDPGQGSARSWAATVAHRRAVDRVRSVQAARRRDEVDGRRRLATHLSGAGEAEVEAEVEQRLDRQAVASMLTNLTDKQREAIELAYYRGFTYREVASMLDVPEGTIKTRIRDGLHSLRSRLSESGGGP